jgi:hypothetical protein
LGIESDEPCHKGSSFAANRVLNRLDALNVKLSCFRGMSWTAGLAWTLGLQFGQALFYRPKPAVHDRPVPTEAVKTFLSAGGI